MNAEDKLKEAVRLLSIVRAFLIDEKRISTSLARVFQMRDLIAKIDETIEESGVTD